MKKRRRITVILGIAIVVSLTIMSGISSKKFLNPTTTNAQQSPRNIFNTINQKAKSNNASPSFNQSKELAELIIQNLSVLEIPEYLQTSVTEQVANANLNGASNINESNIATAINNLADQSSAPNYAYTNVEQVKVVRTFLNRLIPDLVSANGSMTDLEAFAVFTATLSQKIDNDAFMVTPAEFSVSMQNPANQPFPGSSGAAIAENEVNVQSAKTEQMLGVVDAYVNSKNMLGSNDIISMVGIN